MADDHEAGGERIAEDRLALAHELRTPLTSLSLGLGLLDEGAVGPLTAAQHEIVRALVGDVARLALLVTRELKTDRLGAYAGPIARAPLDLGELVHGAVAPIVRQAEASGTRLTEELDAGLVVVADPVKLAWVIAYLTGNALRYSSPGQLVRVSLRAEAGEALLRISDEGPGVAPALARTLFDRSGGGGLFLVRETVEAHGARIRVEPAPGRGASFVINLPLARGDAGGRSP